PLPIDPTNDSEARNVGVAVTIDDLPHILAGECFHPAAYNSYQQLFVQRRSSPEVRVSIDFGIDSLIPIAISPNGRYVVLQGFVQSAPQNWRLYSDPEIAKRVVEINTDGYSNVLYYVLVDTDITESS